MSVPIKDASTVMLMRESESGLELYLTRRRDDLRFMGGFYVFPGGKVDAADSSPDILNRCANLDRISPSNSLGLNEAESFSASLYIAACRELFEESGVMLAEDNDGNLIGHNGEQPRDLLDYRERVISGLDFHLALSELNLFLRPDRLIYFSRWVTPAPSTIRFDTRFFGALLPPSCEASFSALEATSACWLTPEAALDRFYSGILPMIPPTIAGIRTVLGCNSFAEWSDKISSSSDHNIYS